MADTVGVDFGTATTLVSEPAAVLPLGRATNGLPSVVRVADGALLVGEDAEEVSPDQVIRSVKRAITERRDVFTLARPDSDETLEVHADDAIAAVLGETLDRAGRAGVALDGPRPVRLGCPAMWDGAQRRR